MARLIGYEIPEELASYIRHTPRKHGEGVALLLVSVDGEGWPHVAVISLWEIALRDNRSIRVALAANSTTTRNLLERNKATLIIVDKGLIYYVKGSVSSSEEIRSSAGVIRIFELKTSQVLKEEGYGFEILSGIHYKEYEPSEPHEEIYNRIRS